MPSEPAAPGSSPARSPTSARRKPIGGAVVDCGAGGAATTTADGAYAVGDVDPGTYQCVASASGYHSKSASVTVTVGATSTRNFALRAR